MFNQLGGANRKDRLIVETNPGPGEANRATGKPPPLRLHQHHRVDDSGLRSGNRVKPQSVTSARCPSLRSRFQQHDPVEVCQHKKEGSGWSPPPGDQPFDV